MVREVNSVNGYRIRASHPDVEEFINNRITILGQFDDGLDRLYQERELTSEQMAFLQALPRDKTLKIQHQNLQTRTENLWQIALNHRDFLNEPNGNQGPYTTHQIGQRLIRFSQAWAQLKNCIDQAITNQ